MPASWFVLPLLAVALSAAEDVEEVAPAPFKGCCFTFSLGPWLKPVNLTTVPDTNESSCEVSRSLSNVTAWHQGECPETAAEAERMSLLPPDKCCFSFDLGPWMKPVNLTRRQVESKDDCLVHMDTHHVTVYYEGKCPTTVDQAAMIAFAPLAVPKKQAALAAADEVGEVEEPITGCCFTYSFGAWLKPVNLTTIPDVEESSCEVSRTLTNVTAFHQGQCPETPAEAERLSLRPPDKCCFSFDLGPWMKPVNLTRKQVESKDDCLVHMDTHHVTIYYEGECPTTVDQAAMIAFAPQAVPKKQADASKKLVVEKQSGQPQVMSMPRAMGTAGLGLAAVGLMSLVSLRAVRRMREARTVGAQQQSEMELPACGAGAVDA